MIDIIDVIRQQVEIWNDEEKCGWCWRFGAPLTESMINRSKSEQDICDCVQVYVTNLRIQKVPRINLNISRYRMSVDITYTFDLNFLLFDELGVNIYNEIPNHPISESTWEKILNPLLECNPEIDFCIINKEVLATQRETWQPVIRKFDNNLSGWTVSVTVNQTIK